MNMACTQNGAVREGNGFLYLKPGQGEAAMLERIKEDIGMLLEKISKKE